MTEKVKACPECGSSRIIGLVSTDVECLTCGMTSMGHLRITQERADAYEEAYWEAKYQEEMDDA